MTNQKQGQSLVAEKIANVFEEISNTANTLEMLLKQAIGAGGDMDQYQVIALQAMVQKIEYLEDIGCKSATQNNLALDIDATDYFMRYGWSRA